MSSETESVEVISCEQLDGELKSLYSELSALSEVDIQNEYSRSNVRRSCDGSISITGEIRTALAGIHVDSKRSRCPERNSATRSDGQRFRHEENDIELYGGTEEIGETFQEREDSIDETPFIRKVCRVFKRTRLLHDFIYFADECELFSQVRRAVRRLERFNIFFICYHEGNAHVIHDCAYTGGRCRCTAVRNFRGNRKRLRSTTWEYEWSNRRWQHLLVYLEKPPRQYLYAQAGGRLWLRSNQIGGVSVQSGMYIFIVVYHYLTYIMI